MAHINLDLASFNAIKYVVITIILTPLTEFLLDKVVLALSKKRMLVQGSVQVSKTRSDLWGLRAHYLGTSWYRRGLVLVPAVWLVASELLLEFSFDSSTRSRFASNPVWNNAVIPSWRDLNFTDNGSVEEQSNYYSPSESQDVDYNMLFDGIFACQTPSFKQSKPGTQLRIEQSSKWRRTYRNLNNVTVECGPEVDVKLTASLLVEESEDTTTRIQGVSYAPNATMATVDKSVQRRLNKFWGESYLLLSDLSEIVDNSALVAISKDRICCVSVSGVVSDGCILDEGGRYGVYYVDPAEGSASAKKLFELVPEDESRDPLLTITESILIWSVMGPFRPEQGRKEERFLSTRQVRDFMQFYLTLDANGGHTVRDKSSLEKVWTHDLPVIVINTSGYVSLGLIALLLFTLIAAVLVCHVLTNHFRAKQVRIVDTSSSRRMFALSDIRLDLDIGYMLNLVASELGVSSIDDAGKPKTEKVVFRIVDKNDGEQSLEVLGDGQPSPRDYCRVLFGYGSSRHGCCSEHVHEEKNEMPNGERR